MKQNKHIATIGLYDVLQQNPVLVDVRSPQEFEQFHIPGALHIPIFSDEERVLVGTLYKQEGKEKAKKTGLELVSKKLPDLYEQFQEMADKYKRIVVYCWRGGMRSKSVVSVMSTLDLEVYQLEGGIRSYRQWIEEGLQSVAGRNIPYVVIEGNTGTAKTKLLLDLDKEGYPVIDLEGLAHHRGSVFGHIGFEPSNQKQFECDLYMRMRELQDADYCIIEAESKRIGKVHLPDFVMRGKMNGKRFFLEAPIEYRVQTICEQYPLHKGLEPYVQAFAHIEKRLNPDIAKQIRAYLAEGEATNVVRLLLVHYYDPRYLESAKKYKTPSETIRFQNYEEGLNKVRAGIDQFVEHNSFPQRR